MHGPVAASAVQCALENAGCFCGEDDMLWWQFGTPTESALRTFQVRAEEHCYYKHIMWNLIEYPSSTAMRTGNEPPGSAFHAAAGVSASMRAGTKLIVGRAGRSQQSSASRAVSDLLCTGLRGMQRLKRPGCRTRRHGSCC